MNVILVGEHQISTGGIATGKEPFVIVIFNDEQMQNKPQYIEITKYDGYKIVKQVCG